MAVERELESVVTALRGALGYRTIWLDPYGRIWHSEPEYELEHENWRLVGTFLRPTLEDVTAAVQAVLPPVLDERHVEPVAVGQVAYAM